MQLSDFDYTLAPELIARYPAPVRGESRLLELDGATGACRDRAIRELVDLVRPGDVLVCNDTRVIPARLFGHKTSGGRVEILIERLTGEDAALAHIRASKSPKAGAVIEVEGGYRLVVRAKDGASGLYALASMNETPLQEILARVAHIPLPPYIGRADEPLDAERYQTVFADRPGAVAAPTAGLHFDAPLVAALEARGVRFARVTLHVGAGTFQPVREERIEDHRMHAEFLEVAPAACAAIETARAQGGRVVAIGTTSARALETAATTSGALAPYRGDTRLFIYPGYRFRAVDALLTNFHLPRSSLLMLVCAFAGREAVFGAYQHAIAARYRFFSYGDAMWVTRRP